MQRESGHLADRVNERLLAVGQGLQREHLAPRVRAHRDAVRDRMAQELIQRSALYGIARQITVLGVTFQQALALQETSDSVRDGVCQVRQLSTRGRLHPAKSEARSIRAIDVDTVQKKHMEVDICIEGTAESLNQRHCAGAGRRAGKSRLLDQVRGNAAIHDAEHFAHDCRTTGKQEPQRVRETQHPLAHRLCGKHLIDQQRRTLRHTPGTAAGTEASSLAAKRYEALGVTSLAPHA